MNTLIYKRTHKGDPDRGTGTFGIHNCMKSVRSWHFDAVIGVGGKRPDHGHEDIALKINWVGIDPIPKFKDPRDKEPIINFERWLVLEESGPDFKTLAPNLFRNMFVDKHVRKVLSQSLPALMQKEVQGILDWAAENIQLKEGSSKLHFGGGRDCRTPSPGCKKKTSPKCRC